MHVLDEFVHIYILLCIKLRFLLHRQQSECRYRRDRDAWGERELFETALLPLNIEH